MYIIVLSVVCHIHIVHAGPGFKREMGQEADHYTIADTYIKSIITNSCSKSYCVFQIKINCARTRGFEITIRFSISFSGLVLNGSFIKIFRVYSKLYQTNINSAENVDQNF